jgi:hypothetical protein
MGTAAHSRKNAGANNAIESIDEEVHNVRCIC